MRIRSSQASLHYAHQAAAAWRRALLATVDGTLIAAAEAAATCRSQWQNPGSLVQPIVLRSSESRRSS